MTGEDSPAWRRYVRFWKANASDDVDEEIRFHVDMRVAEYVRRGAAPEAARAAADRRFGDSRHAREQCLHIHREHERAMTRSLWLEGFRQDLVFATRVLRRQALPTLAATFCIALGVGASTAMFSVADTMLRRPLPFPNGDRLVLVTSRTGQQNLGTVSSVPDFADLRSRQHSFQALGGTMQTSFTWLRGEPTRVSGALVTGGLFNALGARAEAGRLFRPDDDRPGAENVVIVSRGFADRWFAGSQGAVDKTINLRGRLHRIVGVVPDAWRFPDNVEMFVPLALDAAAESRGNRYLRIVAALTPGIRLEQAQADLAAVAASIRRDVPADSAANLRFELAPLRSTYVAQAKPALGALGLATLLVLLIACANVAGLQLARASARYREIALRGAIGAERGRVLRQLLTESVLLAVVGGLGGCLLAWWGSKFIGLAVTQSAPPWMTFRLDPWALVFSVVVSGLAGIAFGIVPAIRLGRVHPATALRGGQATGPERGRLQRMFVSAEIALSTILLVGAGMAMLSVNTLTHVPLGFEPNGVITFKVSLQGARYDSAANRAAAIASLADRIETMPDVKSAGAVTYPPVSGCCSQFGTKIEGREGKDPNLMVTGNMVTAHYFQTMGIRVLQGRGILPTDVKGAQRVVVINETFAKRFWPGGKAIGRRIDTGGGWADIVGIVADVKQDNLTDGPELQFYRAHAQDPWEDMTFVIRPKTTDLAAVMPAVRRTFKEIDATQPLFRITPMSDIVERSMNSERLLGRLLTTFALVALILATAGVYAAMSSFVAQRTQELGLRMALGASRTAVVGLVLSRAGAVVVVGLAAGLSAAVIAGRILSHHLYGVDAWDVRVYGIAVVALGLAALVATLGPSRHAMSVDPMSALRSE